MLVIQSLAFRPIYKTRDAVFADGASDEPHRDQWD
jgi:hypothetical protein